MTKTLKQKENTIGILVAELKRKENTLDNYIKKLFKVAIKQPPAI